MPGISSIYFFSKPYLVVWSACIPNLINLECALLAIILRLAFFLNETV